jgi:hypothetical protein
MGMNSSERTISAAEVKQWVGASSKAKLTDAQYDQIAVRLTKFRWNSDPPPSPSRGPKLIDGSDERWWDIKATTKAARTLRDSMPKMLAFQKTLQWAPETRDGYNAIDALKKALVAASPYIEHPFGGKGAGGRKRAKQWHIYAFLIAQLIIDEMIKAGHPKPGITRNSVVVRVVQKALKRMGVDKSGILSTSTIGMYLTRRNNKYGPAFKNAMTTK